MEAVLQSILRGLVTYRTGIFILLGLGILVYLRKLIIGIREWQKSVFGLERSIAQRMLITASTGLILLLFLFVGEFLLVTVIEPQMPAQPMRTQSLAESPAVSTESLPSDDDDIETQSMVETELAAQPASEAFVEQGELVSECIEDIVEITFPADGDTISGSVEIIGSVNVDNFGSYKYEYSPTGNIDWITIAAGNQLKLDENIGFWYTSALTPGTYFLRLVPLNNVGEEMTPCVIAVEVRQVEEN